MSNDVTILAALNSIEEAIRGCCGGGNAPLDEEESTATPAEVYKCKAAYQMVDDFAAIYDGLYQSSQVGILDVAMFRPEAFGTLYLWFQVKLPLTATNLLQVYANNAAAIVTYFLYDQAQPIADLDVFDGLRTAWLADTDITCELYNAANPTEAKAAIEAKVSALLGGLAYSTEQNNMALDATTAMLTNANINRLFDTDATIDALPAQDCAGCGSQCLPVLLWGTLVDNGSSFDVSTTNSGGNHTFLFNFLADGLDCGRHVTVSIIAGGLVAGYWKVVTLDSAGAKTFSPQITSDGAFLSYLAAQTDPVFQLSISYNTQPTTLRMTYD